jgi:hypothetical protein
MGNIFSDPHSYERFHIGFNKRRNGRNQYTGQGKNDCQLDHRKTGLFISYA